MSKKKLAPIETLLQKKNRLLQEVEHVNREMAEIEHVAELADKLGFTLAEKRERKSAAGGTLRALMDSYVSSTAYTELRFKTREYYDYLMKPFIPHGSVKLADLKAKDIQRIYDRLTEKGTVKLAMGRAVMTILRVIVHHGASALSDPECERLSVLLHNMRFALPKARTKSLSRDDVVLIIKTAHEMGFHSIALAQAFQYDLKLRQKDCIGEWVPLEEKGTPLTDVMNGDVKWLRGLRWDEIDENLVLRHPNTVGGKLIEIALRPESAPLVMQELSRMDVLPKSGPIIISERTSFPWIHTEFRRYWRKVARAAGLPDDVRNGDARLTRSSVRSRNEQPVGAGRQPTG